MIAGVIFGVTGLVILVFRRRLISVSLANPKRPSVPPSVDAFGIIGMGVLLIVSGVYLIVTNA